MKYNNARMTMINENPETGVRRYECHCGERFTYDPARLENVAPATADGTPGVMCPTCDCIRPESMTNGDPAPPALKCFKLSVKLTDQEEPANCYGETSDLPSFLYGSLMSMPYKRDKVASMQCVEISREEYERDAPPRPEHTDLYRLMDAIFGKLF